MTEPIDPERDYFEIRQAQFETELQTTLETLGERLEWKVTIEDLTTTSLDSIAQAVTQFLCEHQQSSLAKRWQSAYDAQTQAIRHFEALLASYLAPPITRLTDEDLSGLMLARDVWQEAGEHIDRVTAEVTAFVETFEQGA
jgi:hypothetical protein